MHSAIAQLSQNDPAMVLDTLDHSARYEALHPRFAKAFAFLHALSGNEEDGRHDIDGDDVFALVQRVKTKPMAEAEFEAHRRYIDIQYLFGGKETILWSPLASMAEQTRPYDDTKDIAKWRLISAHTPLHMSPGHFTIFFPEDAHAPCVVWEESGEVAKVVIKIRQD